jgi:NTP pyrophosphatase (non-canonical NTP hydrolase)
MTFDNYQSSARLTAKYPRLGNNIEYPTLGLAGEAGELCNKVKKIQRDDNGIITLEKREQLLDELGDVLWYCAAIADELDADLGDIAEANIKKLFKRQIDNTISGEGDKR